MKKIMSFVLISLISLLIIMVSTSFGEQNGEKNKKCRGVGKYTPDPGGITQVFVCPAPESTDSCNYPCVSNNNSN